MRFKKIIILATIFILLIELYGIFNLNVSYKYEVDHMETLNDLGEADDRIELEKRRDELNSQLSYGYIRLFFETFVLIILFIQLRSNRSNS